MKESTQRLILALAFTGATLWSMHLGCFGWAVFFAFLLFAVTA